MAGSNYRSGGFGSLTPRRTSREEQPASHAAGFSELLAAPLSGPFVLPANAVIAIYGPCGSSSNYPVVTLTEPDGRVRTIDRLNLNPGGRTVISGVVKAGTLVEAAPGLEVQVSVGPLEWQTIARG
jgi:hypothetical protein